MKALIDATVKFHYQHDRGNPASIETICDHLDDVYKAVQHETHQRDKCVSGIRAHIMSNTIKLFFDDYSNYLLNTDVLDSDFFILARDVIARAFNETRHEPVSEDEKKLLEPICEIILKITESMTPELADSKMISLFFEKIFVSSMADGLKAFAANKVLYGAEQKTKIIKAILNMFSEYCRAKGDAAVSNVHLVSLVNAALCCISSSIYLPLFIRQLDRKDYPEQLSPKNELFLDVCPKYVVNYKRARHEAMFVEAKHLVVEAAVQILPRFIQKTNQIPPYLLQSMLLLVELLLLISSESFRSEQSLIKDLISIVKLSETDLVRNETIKIIIQRSISLIYTLTINENLRRTIIEILSQGDMIHFFDKLSLKSTDRHIRFASGLISWTLNKENVADRKYSPEIIKTLVHYLNKCGGDPLQQYHGVPIDSMITTLTGLVENDDAQKELVKQDAVPVMVKCATDTQFNVLTVQQPTLECLWTMAFMPEVLLKLSESPEFLAHLRTLINTPTTTVTASAKDEAKESSEEMKRVAEGVLWKIEKEPVLLAKKNSSKKESPKKFEYDIMISYQRNDQKFCEKLYNRLTNENKFRVWLDEKVLYGSIMTQMAEAIEKSEFVVILMSELYQKSPYCRSELIYASKIKRHIIPLKLYRKFRPSSWLGFTVADLYYIDFSKEGLFDGSYKDFIKQIELNRRPPDPGPSQPLKEETVVGSDDQEKSPPNLGRRRPTFLEPVIDFVSNHIGPGKTNGTDALHSDESINPPRATSEKVSNDIEELHGAKKTEMFSKKPLKSWTCNDVEDFVRLNRLEKFTSILSEADGTDLFLLFSMSRENHTKLLECLKEINPEVNLIDYRAFVKAMKNYVEETEN